MMSSKLSRTKVKPQMFLKETLYRTKKFFHKTFRNLKSFILVGYQKLSTTPTANPIFSGGNKINSKLQELDNFYRSFSKQWDSIEVVKKKEGQLSPNVQTKEDEQYSKNSTSTADCSGLEDLKEERKASKYSGRKQKESSFMAAEALAQKMKDLEMMDVNDMDHVLDIEEVLHYYSRLNCPSYLEIVDKFFMDMYSEFHVPQPSRSVNSSMRKLGSASVHSSMRSLGPLKL
ncbi:hypothetical protein Pfo_012091 [Paulownia fortunei]|nr:hypothetical protein Pfo_012091 [Paulownia fortunei]